MVMKRAEDASGFYGHHAHAQFAPGQSIHLTSQVDRRQDSTLTPLVSGTG